eukprot:SM000084S23148  [mRNA]  locus=s84:552074:559947:+ [translate_table: standard]
MMAPPPSTRRLVRPGPELDLDLPALLPVLRPYQRRAANWMVNRERGAVDTAAPDGQRRLHPLWTMVAPLGMAPGGDEAVYYNPYRQAQVYLFSREAYAAPAPVRGGILADEMGLGKTVELLACVLANPAPPAPPSATAASPSARVAAALTTRRTERVDCPCGAVTDDGAYHGTWVQCDLCDVWQHAKCVGYRALKKSRLEAQRSAAVEDGAASPGSLTGSAVTEAAASRGDDDCADEAPDAVADDAATVELKATRSRQRRSRSQSSLRAPTPPRGGTNGGGNNGGAAFACGECQEILAGDEVKGVCRATLIVCPPAILRQWQDEICRHTRPGALRVVTYAGMRAAASASAARNRQTAGAASMAAELASADMVLATYDTLLVDLSHDDREGAWGSLESDRTLRNRKRYRVLPTPLTRLTWWRVCLDEAQVVEGPTAGRATELALRLRAAARWCITGTPVQRSFDDLFGLLRFLRAEPFDERRWWTRVLLRPYQDGDKRAAQLARALFGELMWRTPKADVASELGLPPQRSVLSCLRFSAVEAHFYRQQHAECAARAREVLAKVARQKGGSRVKRPQVDQSHALRTAAGPAQDKEALPGSGGSGNGNRALTATEWSKVLGPLLRLRQACCHPQVGSAGVRSLQPGRPMNMDEILEVLTTKARLEAEEAQRLTVAALNGLAALAVTQRDRGGAAALYREALTIVEENASEFRADPLQRLHTLHNLQEVLGALTGKDGNNSDSVGRTLRDDRLADHCAEIREQYVAPFRAKLAAAQHAFDLVHSQARDAEAACDQEEAGQLWWHAALALVVRQRPDGGRELVDRLKSQLPEADHLGNFYRNASTLANRFRDVAGLQLVLRRELDALAESRRALMLCLDDLRARTLAAAPNDVEATGQCGSCHSEFAGPPCPFCRADEVIQPYENRLFFLRTEARSAGQVASAEEAVITQQRSLARNRQLVAGVPSRGRKKHLASLAAPDPSMGRGMRNVTGQTSAARALVTWSPSESEKILRILVAYLKSLRAETPKALLAAGSKHLEYFEALRKEFAEVRVLGNAQRGLLYALDELNMATTRIRLQLPGEAGLPLTEAKQRFVVSPEEVPARNHVLTSDKFVAAEELAKAKGQLRYLKGLQLARRRAAMKSDNGVEMGGESSKCSSLDGISDLGDGAAAEDACPVCHERLGLEFAVLPCGHLLCCKCTFALADRAPPFGNGQKHNKRIRCPNCRRGAFVSDIACIDNNSKVVSEHMELSGSAPMPAKGEGQRNLGGDEVLGADLDEDQVEVRGSYGTKLEAVVRRVKWLLATDPGAKVLIFSTWHEVLDVVQHALQANTISLARVKGRRDLDLAIQHFQGKGGNKVAKDNGSGDCASCLLLQVQQGANGLNLVEAQHVLLVEPLLNPAAEAQAVNRVHRIGQSRPTFVHRFIIGDTVEERIEGLRRRREADGLQQAAVLLKASQREVDTLTLADVSELFTTAQSEAKPSEAPQEAASGGAAEVPGSMFSRPPQQRPAADLAAAADALWERSAAHMRDVMARAAEARLLASSSARPAGDAGA